MLTVVHDAESANENDCEAAYHLEREVLTAAGAVEVAAPVVDDRRVEPYR